MVELEMDSQTIFKSHEKLQ